MKRLGYIRTSTSKQLIDRQIHALQDVCDEVFIEDGVSAVKKKRPVYDEVMQKLQPGDEFVVSSFDRAFRSVIDALLEMEKLKSRGIQFRSLTQQFDTNTPEGELIYTMLAALAQWERRILSERTKDGLVAARARGKRLGRPPKLTPKKIKWAKEALKSKPDQTIGAIAAVLKVHRRTLASKLNQT